MDIIGINTQMAVGQVQSANNVQKAEKVVIKDYPDDSFEFTTKENEGSLTKAEKQETVKQAKTTAAGWSSLFGVFDTLYYGLRSDKTVAKKFNLDETKDKDLIKTIKREQMKATLPAALGTMLFGVGTLLTGGLTWLYNKNSDPSKIDV